MCIRDSSIDDGDIVNLGLLKPPDGEGYDFINDPDISYIDEINISGSFASGEPNIHSYINKSSQLEIYGDPSYNVHTYPYMAYTFGVQLLRQVSNLTLTLSNITRNATAMYPFLTRFYINYIVQAKDEPFTSFENSIDTIYYEEVDLSLIHISEPTRPY